MNFIITGFLFTALPQFTNSQVIQKHELLISSSLLIFAFLTSYFPFILHAFMFSFYCYLLMILISRLLTAKQAIPYSFYFLPIAITYGLIAQIIWLMPIDGLEVYAKKLSYYGYILGAFMGVGLRLIPGMLGHSEIVIKQRKNYEAHKPITTDYKILLILFNLQVLFDVFNLPKSAILARLSFIGLSSITFFKIYTRPKNKTWHAWGVWLSIWSIMIGVVLVSINPENQVHWLHQIFVNGFVLMALMVMTRVTRAHNHLSPHKEDSRVLLAFIGLTIFAGLTRVTAFVTPSYDNHLAYAAFLLIGVFFGLFLYLNEFKPKKQHEAQRVFN